MATTVRSSLSSIRNTLKSVKEDPFMTDRYLYALLMKYAKTLIKRASERKNIFKHKSLFKELGCIEMIEVDKVEACCTGIATGCTFMRTKNKLPKMLNINSNPLIKSISSLDYSVSVIQTDPKLYANMTKTSGFKYNKTKYYWFLEDHIYIPTVMWEAIRLSAVFEEDISHLKCDADATDCVQEQDRDLDIPEHLFTEIEQLVRQEVLTAGQLPPDGADDSQNVLR